MSITSIYKKVKMKKILVLASMFMMLVATSASADTWMDTFVGAQYEAYFLITEDIPYWVRRAPGAFGTAVYNNACGVVNSLKEEFGPGSKAWENVKYGVEKFKNYWVGLSDGCGIKNPFSPNFTTWDQDARAEMAAKCAKNSSLPFCAGLK